MSPFKIIRALGAICIVCIHFNHASGQTSSAEEKILLDIENQRTAAFANKNWSVLNSIYQDQFRGITPTGAVVDKKAMMEIFKSAASGDSFSNEDMKASIYGYAGVTSVNVVQKSKDGSIVSQIRLMHVYVKRNGKWTIVEGQGTIIQP